MNCLKLKNSAGDERLIALNAPYTQAPDEKMIGLYDCDGSELKRQPIISSLAQEMNAEIGAGMGDWIKVLAQPFAKMAGKEHCTMCEAKRIIVNAYGQLKAKYGLVEAVAIMTDAWQTAKNDPDAALVKVKEKL